MKLNDARRRIPPESIYVSQSRIDGRLLEDDANIGIAMLVKVSFRQGAEYKEGGKIWASSGTAKERKHFGGVLIPS